MSRPLNDFLSRFGDAMSWLPIKDAYQRGAALIAVLSIAVIALITIGLTAMSAHKVQVGGRLVATPIPSPPVSVDQLLGTWDGDDNLGNTYRFSFAIDPNYQGADAQRVVIGGTGVKGWSFKTNDHVPEMTVEGSFEVWQDESFPFGQTIRMFFGKSKETEANKAAFESMNGHKSEDLFAPLAAEYVATLDRDSLTLYGTSAVVAGPARDEAQPAYPQELWTDETPRKGPKPECIIKLKRERL